MAMEKGKFDANKVAYINLSQTRGLGSSLGSDLGRDPDSQQPPAATEPTGLAHPPEAEGGASASDLLRAAAIAQKPGGHANRLQVLEAFRRWLDDQNRNTGNQN